jgi:GH35 family endo-1,4-beta-xylanase
MNRIFLSSVSACFLFTFSLVRAGDVYHLTPPPAPIPPTYFGMHIHQAADKTPWPAVSMASWRLWDARVAWPQLEPKPGQWQFGVLDKYLALAKEHQVQVLLPLGLSPQWASARPQEKSVYGLGFAAEPRNIEDWRKYVSTVVTHCKGRVGAYEIWNEPNNKGFWTGSTEQLIELTRETYTIVHSIDSHAVVVSPAATTLDGVPWLEEFLRNGGGNYVDAIGYHFYVSPQAPEAMVPLAQRVREVMAETRTSEKPLWNTESGWQIPKPFPSDYLAAAYLARAYILNWASGVQRFYWYAWDNHSWVSIETTEPDNRSLTAAGHAYETVYEWLVGTEMKFCDEDANQTWTCELSRNGSPRWIVWNSAGTREFAVPAAWRVQTVTPMFGEQKEIRLTEIEVNVMPQLVDGLNP